MHPAHAMRQRHAVQRVARALLVAPLLALAAGVVLAACGDTPSELAVSAKAEGSASAKPGGTVGVTVAVSNQGPGGAAGVKIQIDLPSGYTYQATPSIDRDPIGASRQQAIDPQKDARSPEWGSWRLDPPSRNADGTLRLAYVRVHATLHVSGTPGDYRVTPKAASDAVGSDVSGDQLTLHLDPAPELHVDVSLSPDHVQKAKDVLYRVTVDNLGTGPAEGLGVLLTLPPGMTYLNTESITGNAARDGPVDPITGTLVAFYGGFTVPAKTAEGPGLLVLTVRARCTACLAGTFPADLHLSDAGGTLLDLKAVAPLVVDG